MSHNPNAKTFQQKMARFEKTLQQFIDSDAFKACVIDHLCHSRSWHYVHQTLKVELLPGGKWVAPASHSWSEHGSCIVTLTQASYHFREMEKIGETRDFEDILAQSADEARSVAEQLYVHQEASLKEGALEQLAFIKERGRLD